MNWCLSTHEIGPEEKPIVGGKAYALATLAGAGFKIPDTLCIATHAYLEFIQQAGLEERILLEINRKDFKDMRWEEVWDASLRIRNMFIRTPLPDSLDKSLRQQLDETFGNRPVVVRSFGADAVASALPLRSSTGQRELAATPAGADVAAALDTGALRHLHHDWVDRLDAARIALWDTPLDEVHLVCLSHQRSVGPNRWCTDRNPATQRRIQSPSPPQCA